MRSTACRRGSSRSSGYSTISPHPNERSPAMIFPPSPRLRTTSPKTCPFISTMRCPDTSSVVTTIISALLLSWLEPSLVLGDAGRLGAITDFELLDRRREVVADRPFREEERFGDLRDTRAILSRDQHLALALRQRADACAERGGGQSGVDDAFAGHGPPDRHGQLMSGRILQHEARRAALHGAPEEARAP